MGLRDQQTQKEGWRRYMRRPSAASLVSVIAHVILGVLVWNAVQMPAVFDRLLQNERPAKPVEERIQFVTVTPPSGVASQPTRSTTRQAVPAARPSSAPNVVPLVAPTEIPRELPAPAASADTTTPGAVVGPLRGGSGTTRGVQPNYDDPRLWVSDLEFFYSPKSYEERLDSALYATLRRHMDSVTANAYSPNKFERGDWTYEKDGKKYGIDNQYIRLGKFSIPNVLLGLLPLNAQGNPIAADRDRAMASLRQEILYQSQRSMNEEEFRRAVKSLRERKERERQQQEKERAPKPISAVEPRSPTP